MASANNAVFPPAEVRELAAEVYKLLKERGETISVDETVCLPALRMTRTHHVVLSKLAHSIGTRKANYCCGFCAAGLGCRRHHFSSFAGYAWS